MIGQAEPIWHAKWDKHTTQITRNQLERLPQARLGTNWKQPYESVNHGQNPAVNVDIFRLLWL